MEVPAKFRSVFVGLHYWLLVLVFMATSTFLVACGGGGTSITISPTVTTTTTTVPTIADSLVIISTPGSVFANGDITITVFARNGGQAVVGEIIDFEITTNNSSSSLDPVLSIVSVATGTNGRARVTYTAGPVSGVTDTITITSTTELITHDVLVNPLPANSIIVTATGATLFADGADQVTIEALVTDTGGLLMDGADVDFTTTAGDICASPAPGLCGAVQPLTATTGSDGIARITLQSSTNLETLVTVEGTTTNLKKGSVDVQFIPGPPGIITLQASPSNLYADGVSPSDVTALVTDADGHIVADGTSVTFFVDAGDGSFPFGNPAVGTVAGLATQVYTAGADASINLGVVDIRAEAGVVDSGTDGDGLITLVDQIVSNISLSFVPDNILTADGVDFAEVRATVLDINSNPIDGITVTFETTGGGFDDVFPIVAPVTPQNADTDVSGVATVYLQSSLVAGQYLVKATSSSKIASAQVEFVADTADNLTSDLAVSSASIPINGGTATLTFTGNDVNGNPIADGTVVTFTADEGVISNVTTTTGGIATATLTSTLAPTIFVGTVNLEANVLGLAAPETATIDFTDVDSINPNSIALALSDTSIPIETSGGSQAIIIQAGVKDTTGQPIQVDCPNNIEFEIIAGPADAELDNLTSTVTKTTVGGLASVALTAGITPGTVRVEVRATMDTSSCLALGTPVSAITTPISIASGEAAIINLFPESDVLDLAGTDFTGQIFNAHVKDAYGNPVQEGTAIRFWLDNIAEGDVCPWGETGRSINFVDPGCSDDSVVINGVARTMLTYAPSFIWGTYTINAETDFGAISDSYSGTYLAVEGVNITVTLSPNPSNAGTQNITVKAKYVDGSTDPNPNPLIGRTLTFIINDNAAGDFGGSSSVTGTTDNNGEVILPLADSLDLADCLDDRTLTVTAYEGPYSGSGDLTVNGTNPTADFSWISTADPTIQFDGTLSSTPVGNITNYDWNFVEIDPPIGIDPAPSYTFTTNGSYAVSLEVTNDAPNCTHKVIKPVGVSNHVP